MRTLGVVYLVKSERRQTLVKVLRRQSFDDVQSAAAWCEEQRSLHAREGRYQGDGIPGAGWLSSDSAKLSVADIEAFLESRPGRDLGGWQNSLST